MGQPFFGRSGQARDIQTRQERNHVCRAFRDKEWAVAKTLQLRNLHGGKMSRVEALTVAAGGVSLRSKRLSGTRLRAKIQGTEIDQVKLAGGGQTCRVETKARWKLADGER